MAAAIPWYRRLEARALAGAGAIVGLSLMAITLVMSQVVSSHTIARAEGDLARTNDALTQILTTRADLVAAQTRLITALPVFRAHMNDTRVAADAATMHEMASMYRQEQAAAFTIVSDRNGRWLADSGVPGATDARAPLATLVAAAAKGHAQRETIGLDGRLYLTVAEPAIFGDEVLGTLTTGYALDDAMAHELARATGHDIAFISGTAISGSSLPQASRDVLGPSLASGHSAFVPSGGVSVATLGDQRYVGAAYPLHASGARADSGQLILLEDWAPTEAFIAQIRTRLLQTGAGVFALALALSLFLSRRMSRPLRELAEVAGEVAKGRWEHRLNASGTAEAAAMADAFNAMTLSLSHWHAEALQRTNELQAAYERFYAVTQSVHDAIVSTDADGLVTFWHPRAEAMFGASEVEAIGRPFSSWLAPSSQERFMLAAQELLAADTAHPASPTFAGDGLRHDGHLFPLELSLAVWHADDQACLTAVVRDVTARQASEALLRERDRQLREAQKMDAIGRLASGIAHDFNNSLMVIQGHAEMLLASLPAEDEVHRRKAEVIVQTTSGAASITRRLLTFGRQHVSDARVIDPRELVAGSQKVLGRLLGDNISVVAISDGQTGCISIDPDQLEQVIINLAINARDAMPNGGELRFEVSNSGEHVAIAVRDSGCGMDPDTAARIFEPFFTTKAIGQGTGLGLSIVYGIITQSGGHIELETAPGAGTTFRLLLPRVEPAADTHEARPAQDGTLMRGTETILLTEDKPLVRRILRKALESAGYTVIEANDAAEALAVAASHQGPIDLLLTDVVMPGEGGFALSRAITALRHDTRTIFMSGHPPGALAREEVDASGWRCLQKPFSLATLSHELRATLDADRAA